MHCRNSLESQQVVDFVKERLDKGMPIAQICEEVTSFALYSKLCYSSIFETKRCYDCFVSYLASFIVPLQMCHECLADSTAGDGTGCDNMTVVIAHLKPPAQEREAEAVPAKKKEEQPVSV